MQLSSTRMKFDTWHDVVRDYIDRGWTDGLPIIPPTPDMVTACLEAAGRSPSEVLGTEPTKGRVITAEKAAVNAVMAGCRPEHFGIVATAVEAMCEPEFNLHAVTASTQGAAVLAIVNGPIAKEIGLNSSVSIFGPGHTANATIGRALRLVIINATGSVSGEIDKATQGHPGKYTWCIAEAEDVSPWGPLADRQGLHSAQDSTVSLFAGLSCHPGGQSRVPEAGGDPGLVQGRHVRRRRRMEPGRGRRRPLSRAHRQPGKERAGPKSRSRSFCMRPPSGLSRTGGQPDASSPTRSASPTTGSTRSSRRTPSPS